MSAEIQFKSPLNPISIQYAVIQNPAQEYWNTNSNAFETLNTNNWHYYAITLTGTGVGDNYITASFPSMILTASVYAISIYQQLSTSPASTDTLLVNGYYNYNGTPATDPFNNWISLANVQLVLPNANTTLLNMLIAQASQILTNAIKRNPLLCFYYEAYDGEGNSYIKMNNYPIDNITNVINNATSTAPVTYAGNQFAFNTEGTIRFIWSANQSGFCAGFQNWTFAFQAGYNVLPQDLQYACLLFVQYLYNYSQIPSLLIDMQKAKDVTVEYSRALAGDFSQDVVFAPIQAILERYMQTEIL